MQHRRRHDAYSDPPGGIDLPQGFPVDDGSPSIVKSQGHGRTTIHRRPKSTDSVNNHRTTSWIVTFSLLMIVVLGAGYYLMTEHEKTQIEHVRQDILHLQLEPLSKEWEEKYATLEEENKRLKKHEIDYQTMILERKQFLDQEQEEKKVRAEQDKQIEYYKTYQTEIHERIQLMSRTLVMEKFGAGPHHIEIIVAFVPGFPKNQETDTDQQRIVIELAPVDEMPHVVYWFLEQVSRGLYDGCSFHRNAGHVVQGGPSPNFLSPPDPKLHRRFHWSGFDSILFQEYSSQFPHEKYTLGFAGRPGGPDFYVSTRNNTRLHGPGGQTSYDDPSEADPCFAKVIEGFDVVDRMQLGPVKPGGYKAFEDNVAIVSMKLLTTAA